MVEVDKDGMNFAMGTFRVFNSENQKNNEKYTEE
jgi:hypothetical protein